MMGFEGFRIPHIMYISEAQSTSQEERTKYYLGGEPDENHLRLTVGKSYVTRTAAYSPSSDIDRICVWICDDDENKGKVCQIDLKNFGNLADLRNKKIEKIIDGSNLS